MSQYDDLPFAQFQGPHSLKWTMYPEDVLPLWVADMDFAVAEPIRRAMQQRLQLSVGYAPSAGEPRLLEVLHGRFEAQGLAPQSLWLMSGVVPGLFTACHAFSQVGDGVLCMVPIYPPFLMAIRETGRKALLSPLLHTDAGYQIDWENLEALAEHAKVLLLCNPHNPSGRVWTVSELSRIAEIAQRYNLIIVSDDLHAEIVYETSYTAIASLSPEIAERTITLNGPCKSFNFAGEGLGYAHSSNAKLLQQFRQAGMGMVSTPSIVAQAATFAAYSDPEAAEWQRQNMTYLQQNRDIVSAYVHNHWPKAKYHAPEGTYLAWINLQAVVGEHPQKIILERAKVGLNEGTTFGSVGAGYVRLNFATSQALLTEALDRIQGVCYDENR